MGPIQLLYAPLAQTSSYATADGHWQRVERVLSKGMATLCEYLQTWKLKLSTTKAVLAVYLNKKEAKRELKVNYNSEILPFCSEPAYLGLTLDRTLTTPIPRITSRKVDIAHCTLEAACWLWLGCWSNNIANSHLSPGSFNSKVLLSCQVPQCSHLPH